MALKVAIIDYGSGNLRSAAKAFEHVAKGEVVVTSNPADLQSASHIVLPGVGAFGDCAAGLKNIPGMVEALEKEVLEKKKPFLGICVGMQLLATKGHEHGTHDGLGWIKGEVVKIHPQVDLPVPHMGWNNIKTSGHKLFDGIENDVYFVHSYQFKCVSNDNVLATTDYGGEVTAAIAKDNIMGVQFHPEKSQQAGLKLLENFLKL